VNGAAASFTDPRFLFSGFFLGQERNEDLVEPANEFADGLQVDAAVG